ncbi:hypothetical protein AURDEDRAFT_99960 [Auricularia subglabra TFB-10046 SS5]|nr:hypothetical protein AURDEDRAFT_99960 [Auricularia subglabra TFB-10046 SS5]
MRSDRPTRALAQSPLFQNHPESLPIDERLQLSYERARAIGLAYNLSRADILTLSSKFWQLHTDPIWSMDGAAGTLCTLQLNCCAGTVAMFSGGRDDLDETIRQILHFEVYGQICLTELGHGLDIINMETTATLRDDGDFDLHTPSDAAAKYMPPTTPVDRPCISVVFARVLANDTDCGIKPFLVNIHDGRDMCAGVTTTLLSPRGGSRPLNHALTSFNHVRLPPSALLGPLEKPDDPRKAFFFNISRVMVGTIAIGSLGVPALQVSSTIAARYSLRRVVMDHQSGAPRPIISFQTQKTPILCAIAQAYVMEAFHHWAVKAFTTTKDLSLRHAIASILKVTMITLAQASHINLGDRCGAQGLFEVNQISGMHADMRGTAIAEGDLLVISIRLASELLLDRYTIPHSTNPTSLLAKHEISLFNELRESMKSMSGHRSEEYNRLILPESPALVNAIGHRMAYDAAVSARVEPALVSLFEASSIRLNSAAFVELGIPRARQREMEATAVDAVYPQLENYLQDMGADDYVSAPLVSLERWQNYVSSLPRWTPIGETGLASPQHLRAHTGPAIAAPESNVHLRIAEQEDVELKQSSIATILTRDTIAV